jgi:hypothetical protein
LFRHPHPLHLKASGPKLDQQDSPHGRTPQE